MLYQILQELIQKSKSSREFFLSLSARDQLRLHEWNEHLHSAEELRRAASLLPALEKQDVLGNWNSTRRLF